jgi:predicted peptidase
VEKLVIETKYLLYLPEQYNSDTTRQWPVLLFLHGSGESGQDIEKVKLHGPPQLIESGKKFPFIVVSPQSDVPSGWDTDQLYKILQRVKRTYRVDASRIYLTGLSMGGYGTWALAMKYPDEFAAIAPVCGGGDTANAWKLRNIPVWNFHGALDNVVPIAGSRNMVAAASRYNQGYVLPCTPIKTTIAGIPLITAAIPCTVGSWPKRSMCTGSAGSTPSGAKSTLAFTWVRKAIRCG